MRYSNAFDALAKETQVELEDPYLTKLHDILVDQGDFQGTEDFMTEAVSCEYMKVICNFCPSIIVCQKTKLHF